MHKSHIFRQYDIRGVYEIDFDLEFARNLGLTYGSYLRHCLDKTTPLVTVGYDARLSSPDISEALREGFIKSGCSVYDLGLITTPMSYFSMFHCEADGGIMVTGSHNPPEYNGFKISKGRTTIFGAEIQLLKKHLDERNTLAVQGRCETMDISQAYVDRYRDEFGTQLSTPCVLDCGNGAAGAIVRRLYQACGLKPTILFEEPDGKFPNHHPDPTVESNTQDLKNKVTEDSALLGIGFDGDADRIGIVDENGRFILGDEIMMVVARNILKQNPGAAIVGDVKCSDRLFKDISDHGGKPVMWKTGHSLIKNKIKELKCPFGGELSGHIFFADRNYGFDDAPYAGLRLLEILQKSGKTFSQLLEGVPKSFNTPEIRLDTTEEKKVSAVNHLVEFYKKDSRGLATNYIDGVRVSFPDGWALARSSNTQPVITLRFESLSEEGLKRIQTEFMELIEPLL